MNIQDAKLEIKHALKAYFLKDEFGNYCLPTHKQRPMFLLGAPGIGKTAIMEQIAQELGVGLVSYSMTHHTRQSALGLPFITQKEYSDKLYDVSEFTMSEIISTVYDFEEKTGRCEGILFLDEINCVSETLMPAMLQFLQYKIFGRHQVPDGWIVVTAGNPSEFNRNARDFDIATWDRLRRIDVEPDYAAWRKYALAKQVHPSVVSYLDIEKDHFYKIETTIDGKSFVTARGWDDLSATIKLYEQLGMSVSEELIGQFIQNEEIAKHFSVYYDLFTKYKDGYQIDTILEGSVDDRVIGQAQDASFDERVSLMGLLVDALSQRFKESVYFESYISHIFESLTKLKDSDDLYQDLVGLLKSTQEKIRLERENNLLDEENYLVYEKSAKFWESLISQASSKHLSFDEAKKAFVAERDKLEHLTQEMSKTLSNTLKFVKGAFGVNKEMLMLVGDLASHKQAMQFINENGSTEYFDLSEALLFNDRGSELIDKIDRLDFSTSDEQQ